MIGQALPWDTWQPVDDHTRYPSLALGHHRLVPRGLVVSAHAAYARAEAALHTATQRDAEASTQPLLPLQAQRFCPPETAQAARAVWAKRWQDHHGASSHLTAHQRDAGTGRPTARTPLKATAWPSQAHVLAEDEAMEGAKHGKACDVLGTNIAARERSDPAVIAAPKGQAHVAGGCRFLQAPLCFVASLLGKKPNRMEG